MKKIRIKGLLLAVVLFISSLCLLSCDSINNMSTQDAYDIGYGAGTLIRVMSGN